MYKEKITEFIQKETLFIPKNGGLNDCIESLLPEIGVDDKYEIVKARGEDIPAIIADFYEKGRIAYGLTGDDLFDEFVLATGNTTVKVLNTYDWFDRSAEFFRPALCFMGNVGDIVELPTNLTVAINKKYELTSRRFLDEKFLSYKTKVYAGDTESKVPEIADCCVEVVYGGSTRKENDLQIIDIVRFSDISLIGPRIDNPWQREYQRIQGRKENPTDSYTSRTLQDPNEVTKKVGDETAELVRAYALQEGIVGEALDVFYATMLVLASSDKSWEEVENALKKRWSE